jgi:hypothetical protein
MGIVGSATRGIAAADTRGQPAQATSARVVAELMAGLSRSAIRSERTRVWAQDLLDSGIELDLDYRHISALVSGLRGPDAQHAAASVWAQSMMDLPAWVVQERTRFLPGTEEVCLTNGLPGPERGLELARAGAIPPLVELLRSTVGREAELAAGALGGLAARRELPPDIVEAGAVAPLVKLLRSASRQVATTALCAIGRLVGGEGDGLIVEDLVRAGAIPHFADMLCSTNEDEARVASNVLRDVASRPELLPAIAGVIPNLAFRAAGDMDWACWITLSKLHDRRDLAWAFDETLLRTRTLLATREDMEPVHLSRFGRCYPSLSEEIRGYESFDAWRVHVKRCDLRRLLLSWRRGVIDVRRA